MRRAIRDAAIGTATIGYINANGNSTTLCDSGLSLVFFYQAEDGIRDWSVTGVQTCALPISLATNQRSRLTHQPPVLDLHRQRRAGDDREEREKRAERERGEARYSLADGAAEREHAAEAHERAADQVVDQVLGVAKALQAEGFRRERPGERAREHPEHRRDAESHHAALVAPEHEKLEKVGLRGDERERLHTAGVGGEEFFLERGGVFGEVADVAGEIPGSDYDEADDHCSHDDVASP